MNRPLFTPRSTTIMRSVLFGLLVAAVVFLAGWFRYYRSPFWSQVNLSHDQPVLFSHRHHAQELGIDCRYCHTSVETSSFAGIPTTHTCLTCHSQLFTDTPMLAPVVESASRGRPLEWNRITDVPDHVYFDHSIHVAKGVACATCHGDVHDMALTQNAQRFTMRWCIECHRDPAPQLEPNLADVFDPHPPPAAPGEPAPIDRSELMRIRFIHQEHLTNCSTCHR